MATPKKLSASLEDYLEAIYHICFQKGEARSKEIMEKLKVTGPSVTEALQLLAKNKLINYAPYQTITLTQSGRTAALEVVKRHEALRNFFIEVLQVEPDIAEEGACKIEHVVSPVVIERMIRYIDFLKAPTPDGRSLAACFADYLKSQDTEIRGNLSDRHHADGERIVGQQSAGRTKSGQLIGLCGNSGNSSEPHLHYHLQITQTIQNGTRMKVFFENVI